MSYTLIQNGDSGGSVRTTINDLLTDINNGSFGVSGSSGSSGSSGASGTSGSSGSSGQSGSSGSSGDSGSSGSSGQSGSSGDSGSSGSSGQSGSSGTSGSGVREYATAYLLRNTTTTSAGAGWRLIDNTFTVLTNSLNISYSNNAFTYNGSGEIIVEVVCSVYPNITLSGSEQLQIGISKNGATPITYTACSWTDNATNALNKLKNLYTSIMATMSTNDYFDIRYNHTGTGFNRNIGVLDGTMTIKTI